MIHSSLRDEKLLHSSDSLQQKNLKHGSSAFFLIIFEPEGV